MPFKRVYGPHTTLGPSGVHYYDMDTKDQTKTRTLHSGSKAQGREGYQKIFVVGC